MWLKATGLTWDVEGMIAKATTEEEKTKLLAKLMWNVGLLKSTSTRNGKYDNSANGESDLLDALRAALGEEIVADAQELLNAIADGGEIELTKPFDVEEAIMVEAETTIKLNNQSIINTKVIERDCTVFVVKNGAKLTIEGEGLIKSVAESKSDYSSAIWANGGEVEIKGGTFENEGDSTDLIYASNGGHIVIEGGIFKAAGPADITDNNGTQNAHSALNVKDADYKSSNASITVKGGKFLNFNPANNFSEGANTNFVAEGYTVMVDGVENLEPWKAGMPDMWFEVVEKVEEPTTEPEIETEEPEAEA